jgi:hypothetical protein
MTKEGAAEPAARIDHDDPALAADPHRVDAALRTPGCPVARSETNGGFWMVITYDEVQNVVHDTERFPSKAAAVPASLFRDFGAWVKSRAPAEGLRRIPEFALGDAGSVRRSSDPVGGSRALPITFPAGRRSGAGPY